MDPMEYIVPNRKRLPYGMMNFAVIRREDYYYVDKTRFIPMIEQADRFFFFIRPRRFGKSLTLNVLQHYYDVRTRDKFNDLFGDLYIGEASHSKPQQLSGALPQLFRYHRRTERLSKGTGCTLQHYFHELLQEICRPSATGDSGRTTPSEWGRRAVGLPLSSLRTCRTENVSLHRRIRPLHQRHPF